MCSSACMAVRHFPKNGLSRDASVHEFPGVALVSRLHVDRRSPCVPCCYIHSHPTAATNIMCFPSVNLVLCVPNNEKQRVPVSDRGRTGEEVAIREAWCRTSRSRANRLQSAVPRYKRHYIDYTVESTRHAYESYIKLNATGTYRRSVFSTQ